uniref:Tudor domain-containing protein n=1 Tax=Heterorhabditis bacteriophora TaxID=37862 RepID=A0A1I7WAR4_HETBA
MLIIFIYCRMYSSLQPVKFEANAFMDNRFAAFVVSIEHGNHYIAECRNGDRVVLLAPDRSLLTQSDEIKEGTLLKIAYYRIYVNSKHIFISFFLTMDEFYDGVKVFEDLHRLRSYQYEILNDEFQSAQSTCMDDFNKLYDIYKKYINPWDPDKEVDFSWYGNDNDSITENSPEVSSSAEDSDPSVFFRSGVYPRRTPRKN